MSVTVIYNLNVANCAHTLEKLFQVMLSSIVGQITKIQAWCFNRKILALFPSPTARGLDRGLDWRFLVPRPSVRSVANVALNGSLPRSWLSSRGTCGFLIESDKFQDFLPKSQWDRFWLATACSATTLPALSFLTTLPASVVTTLAIAALAVLTVLVSIAVAVAVSIAVAVVATLAALPPAAAGVVVVFLRHCSKLLWIVLGA